MELWIQGALFDGVTPPVGTGRNAKRQVLGNRKTKYAGWLPVTRDPQIALSHGEGMRIASDFRLGLARALGQLPAETRLAIRRSVAPVRRDNAA